MLERLRFRPFVEDGIHTWSLCVRKKTGGLRGFLAARGLLKGRGLHVACYGEKGELDKVV